MINYSKNFPVSNNRTGIFYSSLIDLYLFWSVSTIPLTDPSINLATLIRCVQNFHEEENQTTPIPLSVFIPTTTITQGETSRQLPSPTNSSSRSTVVRSQSSSDVESPNEQALTKTLVPQDNAIQTNIEKEETTNKTSSEIGSGYKYNQIFN